MQALCLLLVTVLFTHGEADFIVANHIIRRALCTPGVTIHCYDKPGRYASEELGDLVKVVLDSHRWVPLSAVVLSTSSFCEENQEDVTLPPNLMEHLPLAVFVN
ncbi:hypothetical protein Tco_1451788, partial [Tanacetum coccineum]